MIPHYTNIMIRNSFHQFPWGKNSNKLIRFASRDTKAASSRLFALACAREPIFIISVFRQPANLLIFFHLNQKNIKNNPRHFGQTYSVCLFFVCVFLHYYKKMDIFFFKCWAKKEKKTLTHENHKYVINGEPILWNLLSEFQTKKYP